MNISVTARYVTSQDVRSNYQLPLRMATTKHVYTAINTHIHFFFSVALRPIAGHGLLILEVSRSHTTKCHSRQDSSGRVISPSQRPLPDSTQHSQQTNIHATGGIPTHDFSRRAAADLRFDRAATGTGNTHIHTQTFHERIMEIEIRLQIPGSLRSKNMTDITVFNYTTHRSRV